MANLKSSKKDAMRNAQNRLINREWKEKIKNLKKTVRNLALNQKFQDAEGKFKDLMSLVAKARKKKIYKPNKSSRVVSRFHNYMKNLGCFQ